MSSIHPNAQQHGGSSLLNDDHIEIDPSELLHLDGTLSMQGNLDLGGNDINNIGSIEQTDSANPLRDSIESYWKLGDTTDEEGNNDLTNNNGVTFNTGSGIADGGFATFAGGTDDTEGLTSSVSSGTGDYSVSGWFRIKGSNGTGGRDPILGFDDGTNQNALALAVNGGDTTGELEIQGIDGGNFLNDSVMTIFDDLWYHAVFTRRGRDIQVYINGILVKTLNRERFAKNLPNFTIGNYSILDRAINGDVAEVGLWRRVLTAEEVYALYNESSGLKYPLDTSALLTGSNPISGINAKGGNIENLNSVSRLHAQLVDYWRFRDKKSEISSRSITTNGSASVNNSTSDGLPASGLYLDATTGNYATVSGNWEDIVGNKEFSLSAWVNLKSLVPSGNLLGWDSGTNNRILIDLTGSGSDEIRVVTISGGGATSTMQTITASTDTWYHLVLTRSGNADFKLYINGSKEGDQTLETVNVNKNLAMGADADGNSDGNVWVADVGLWVNRVLTASEVDELYRGGVGITYPLQLQSAPSHNRFLSTSGGSMYGGLTMRDDLDMDSFNIDNVASLDNGGSSINMNDALDLNDNAIDNVKAIDGGGDAVIFNDNIDMNANDIVGIGNVEKSDGTSLIFNNVGAGPSQFLFRDDGFRKLEIKETEILADERMEVYADTSTSDTAVMAWFSNLGGTRTEKGKVQADGNAQIDGTLTESSDRRIKRAIEPVRDSIWEDYKKLCVCEFERTDTGVKTEGLIAQDVENVFPRAVRCNYKSESLPDMRSIQPSYLLYKTVQVIQELQSKVERQKTEISGLKGQITRINNRLRALEHG